MMGIIRSKVLRGQFFSLETHRFHSFCHLVARSVLESEVEVSSHNLVLLALIFASNG